jgi:hypothetical protein
MHFVTTRLFAAITIFTAASSTILGAGCSSPAGEDASSSSDEEAINAQTIATVALANVGKRACSTNSRGGAGFDSSCHGNGGQPEYWCADFARWAWAAVGADTAGLSAAAGSFYVYGQNHGTLHSTPRLGDAVVFNYKGNGYADHVAIVTKVNSNGTIESVSGDWGGESGSEAHFSSTSRADLNGPAYWHGVGSVPGIMGMRISGFISPAGTGAPPHVAACTEGPGYCTATSQCENGRWVPRASDPTACTSGPGASTSDACSEGPGYCTASSQCENHHWVPRASDPAACTSGPGA